MNTVVVIGAGYAGLSACLDLGRQAERREWSHEFQVVLVNEDHDHTFATELHSLAVGMEDEADVRVPLDRVLRLPVRLEVGRVEAVDTARRAVYLGSETVDYDHLIVAVGSVPEDYGVEGVRRFGHTLTDTASALDLRGHLDSLAARGWGSVVLVGGGLTGVELAAEIKDVYRGRLEVVLLEAGAAIMAGIEPALAEASRRLLEEKGVQVRAGTQIAAVHGRTVEVREGEPLPYDCLIWTAGVRANPLLARSGFAVDRRDRALTDAYLRARHRSREWVAGDCAAFPMAQGGFLAPTAQAAEQGGRVVAHNVLRALHGLDPEPFEPRIRGFFASLGEWEAVGQAGREDFIGLPAVLIKRMIEAHHAFEAGGLHTLTRRLWRDGGRLLWGGAMGGRRFESRVQAGSVAVAADRAADARTHGVAVPARGRRP